MTKNELKIENEDLKVKIQSLQNKNKLLKELASYYADPMVEWDSGRKAKKVIKMVSNGYKPVQGELAVLFKEKEVYPFVEFGSYIDDREGDDFE